MNLADFLNSMIEAHASDVFIVAGLPLTYRVDGHLVRSSEDSPLSPADTEAMVWAFYEVADRQYDHFAEQGNHDEDFSFALFGVGRFRVNVFHQRGSVGAVVRVIPFGLPDPEECGIPEEVLQLTRFQKGLVLVTGSAGMGKSTTLACMIDRLNHERSGHIVTMEDPIEYIHRHGTCIVTQREIPTDVATFSEALRCATREAADVILLGEMRDAETIATALTAAEMSQLIFSTLNTSTVESTINRIVDAFPPSQQRRIRMQLSQVLQAVVSQQLVPTVDGGVAPAFEIMVVNNSIRNLIRKDKMRQIDEAIEEGKSDMRTMDQSLYDLVQAGRITPETALAHASHPGELEERLS